MLGTIIKSNISHFKALHKNFLSTGNFPCLVTTPTVNRLCIHVTASFKGNEKISCPRQNMSKPKVYVTKILNDEAMNELKKSCEISVWTGSDPVPKDELIKNIANADGLLCILSDKISKEIIDNAKQLKIVATMSVGYDHLDLTELKKRGIKIAYTPNILTDATAELTVALLLATSRRIVESHYEAKTGGWKAWSPFWMCGPGLSNSTVGIVGFGRIAQEVAKRLKSFNPKKIIYFNRSERKEAKEIGAVRVDFETLLRESDFISVNCALTPETKELFNREAFGKMKPNAVFVNTARGGIVQQDALIEALQSGKIWGAGLDVTTPEPLPLDSPLFKLKNCVVIPHIGSAATETRNAMAMLCVENILAALNGTPLPSELIV